MHSKAGHNGADAVTAVALMPTEEKVERMKAKSEVFFSNRWIPLEGS